MSQASFRNLVEISSGPVALFGLRFDKSVKTPFSLTLMSGANGMVLVPRSGMLDMSSVVNTDENC